MPPLKLFSDRSTLVSRSELVHRAAGYRSAQTRWPTGSASKGWADRPSRGWLPRERVVGEIEVGQGDLRPQTSRDGAGEGVLIQAQRRQRRQGNRIGDRALRSGSSRRSRIVTPVSMVRTGRVPVRLLPSSSSSCDTLARPTSRRSRARRRVAGEPPDAGRSRPCRWWSGRAGRVPGTSGGRERRVALTAGSSPGLARWRSTTARGHR